MASVEFILQLPEGYDERTVLALDQDNRIIAVHPELPPLVFDEKAGQFNVTEPDHG